MHTHAVCSCPPSRSVHCRTVQHYWRVPDRNRWRPILQKYRSGGLNAVRIYFHWGYHSPNEGVYVFDGNRSPRRAAVWLKLS